MNDVATTLIFVVATSLVWMPIVYTVSMTRRGYTGRTPLGDPPQGEPLLADLMRGTQMVEHDYELDRCHLCGSLMYVSKSGPRDILGRRHICGDQGESLLKSPYESLEPLTRPQTDDLRK